jgi:phosphate transport system substrate-binding protein
VLIAPLARARVIGARTTMACRRRACVGSIIALLAATGRLGTAGAADMSGPPVAEAAWIRVEGSSTLFPISEEIADVFQILNDSVRVTVAFSGTGGGFERFTRGECDIIDASRPISAREQRAIAEAGFAYIELPVAQDGLAVAVHPTNDWVDHLTVEELRRLWASDRRVQTWSDLRANWPARAIRLYGPGPASGTYDHFSAAVLGGPDRSRRDYLAHEDDNVLAQGIAGDPDALGYFGNIYARRYRDRLRVVPIDEGNGPVYPVPTCITAGSYRTLSRLLFLYVRAAAAQAPATRAFLEFYLTQVPSIAPAAGAVPLSADAYDLVRGRLARGCIGSAFVGASPGADVVRILADAACSTREERLVRPSGEP